MKHIVSFPAQIVSNPKTQEYEGEHIKSKYNQRRVITVSLTIEADTTEEVECKIQKMFQKILEQT
jgi:hypothetical protein